MENFLPKKYPDLPGSKPVERAVQKVKRSGETIPHTKDECISAYLDRFEKLMKDERSFSLLKHKLLEKYVTKSEEIPASYWQLQERIMREQGQGGDWEQANDGQKAEIKRQNSEGVLADQRASLEQWVDYLASSDSDYMLRDLKYWAFRNIIGLQEYDKEKKEFPKRSKGTMKQFPDINHEALAYVIDAVMKKYEGKGMEFEYDIQPDEREVFNRFLEKEDFAKLYAWANDLMNPVPEHLLPITQGEWRKFDQGSDHQALVGTIRGKGTGWCTAGENTAKKQLQGGAFYVFYSLDDNEQPTIPRIAIRMEGSRIAEDPRGVAHKQNLDPYMGEVLSEKLKEFGSEGDAYKKKSSDMKCLTAIEKKTNQNEVLTREELSFLYEMDGSIEGFGYQKDPRIQEIRSQRNQKEDLPIIFECTPNQIAYRKDEIEDDTKAYIGEWTPEIMKLIPENIHYVYEEFPLRKAFFQTIESDLSIRSAEDAIKALTKKGNRVSDWAKDMLRKVSFSREQKQFDLVSFSVISLGFPEGATRAKVYKRAQELGLDLCPAEVGPQLRLQYEDQSMGEWLAIGMEPVAGADGNSRLFDVNHDDDDLWLGSYDGRAGSRWNSYDRFVFLRRK